MGRRQRRRLQRRREEGRLPRRLIPQILLKLYEAFSDHDPQRGKVLRRTLSACRLVCRLWSKIVRSIQGGFIIRAYHKEWLSPSFPYIILRHTLPLRRDRGIDQEHYPRWCPENYTTILVDSHPKFPPELMPNLLSGLGIWGGYWNERNLVTQSTLAACCLVSREWNIIFTPHLYRDILLDRKSTRLNSSHSGESRMPSSA